MSVRCNAVGTGSGKRLEGITYVETISQTGDNSRDYHLCIAERRRLENSANNHDDTAKHDGLPATELVANPKVGKSTDQTPDFLEERTRSAKESEGHQTEERT